MILLSFTLMSKSHLSQEVMGPPTHSYDAVLSTCVVSRFLLFTDDHKLLVLAIGIAQLLAQLLSGNWYCFAIGIAPAIGIAFSVFRATDFCNLDLPATDGADDALQFSPLLFFSLLSTHPSVFSLKIYFPTFAAVLPVQTNQPTHIFHLDASTGCKSTQPTWI